MKFPVILSICGKQTYMDQEPEVIELITDGVMERVDDAWYISYEESDLTGLAGVTTTFQVACEKIVLTRTGKLNSQMVFQKGISHDSLYQMEFGALMITVCASRIHCELTEKGGYVDLIYGIEIEHNAAGVIDYHLEIKPKE